MRLFQFIAKLSLTIYIWNEIKIVEDSWEIRFPFIINVQTGISTKFWIVIFTTSKAEATFQRVRLYIQIYWIIHSGFLVSKMFVNINILSYSGWSRRRSPRQHRRFIYNMLTHIRCFSTIPYSLIFNFGEYKV